MSDEPPLAGHYGATLAMVLLALVPDIILTTAFTLLEPGIGHAIKVGPTAAEVTNGLSNASYAFGALSAGYLIQRFRPRRLFLLSEAAFVLGSALAATSGGIIAFGAGRILQGAATGVLLVVALPPLTTQFSSRRLPTTVAAVNIGFFGAVTLGPVVAGPVLALGLWRWLFAVVGIVGAVGFAFGWLIVRGDPPRNPGRKPQWSMFALAAAATGLPFFGTSELTSVPFSSPVFLGPLVAGLAALVALVVSQYRRSNAVVPVKYIKNPLPLAGTLVAMVAGASFVSLLTLAETLLTKVERIGPVSAGLAFWPEVLGVALSATVFGALFRTRWLAHFVLAGLVFLIAAGIAMTRVGPATPLPAVMAIAGALGAGAGATVAPALYMAGMAVSSRLLGSVFGLVEMVRSEADFLVAPVMLAVAEGVGKAPAALASGLREAALITLAITLAGTVGTLVIYFRGKLRPAVPDLDAWLDTDAVALSPKETLSARRASHNAPSGLKGG